MKNLFFFALIAFLSVSFVSAQGNLRVEKLNRNLKISAELGAGFKAVAKQASDSDDDCTPPPCTGIIDPWTCECHPDLKDPWGDEKIAQRMKAVQQFEAGLKRGEGKSLITKEMYQQAQRKYPGQSLKAMVARMNYYNQRIGK